MRRERRTGCCCETSERGCEDGACPGLGAWSCFWVGFSHPRTLRVHFPFFSVHTRRMWFNFSQPSTSATVHSPQYQTVQPALQPQTYPSLHPPPPLSSQLSINSVLLPQRSHAQRVPVGFGEVRTLLSVLLAVCTVRSG